MTTYLFGVGGQAVIDSFLVIGDVSEDYGGKVSDPTDETGASVNTYVAEDGVTIYVTEDGVTPYVPES